MLRPLQEFPISAAEMFSRIAVNPGVSSLLDQTCPSRYFLCWEALDPNKSHEMPRVRFSLREKYELIHPKQLLVPKKRDKNAHFCLGIVASIAGNEQRRMEGGEFGSSGVIP